MITADVLWTSSTDHGSVRLSLRHSIGGELAARGAMRTHVHRRRRARRVLLAFRSGSHTGGVGRTGGCGPGWLVDRTGGANSNGVGFCLSQLAQFPELSVGTSSAGEAIRELATSGPGAVPNSLEGARYPACGGPAGGD
jgi:hypothetical protein